MTAQHTPTPDGAGCPAHGFAPHPCCDECPAPPVTDKARALYADLLDNERRASGDRLADERSEPAEPKPINQAILDAAFAKVDAQALRIETLEGERDLALRECVKLATEAGFAKGKLEASEAAGIVDGWREKCERLEASLTCVLPMAKGYAHANPVGRNAEMIAEASRLLGTEGRDDG